MSSFMAVFAGSGIAIMGMAEAESGGAGGLERYLVVAAALLATRPLLRQATMA